ncbi:hypothetical protein C1645_832767 [Glomus cerebriforme]|uniref:Uncharacterized protein n=1 Tax=Glomus cerebriforme TaxID=658196 RepID=A0A397SGS2_9GLOM|nr:hypothetical protein C1645_832767 [Glomus cerebriforme]
MSAYAPDLSALSTKIFVIYINSASVERLFSSMEQQDDDQFNVSDDDKFFNQAPDDSEYDIKSSHEWRNLVNKWIEMIENKESELNREDEENVDIEPLIDRIMDLD